MKSIVPLDELTNAHALTKQTTMSTEANNRQSAARRQPVAGGRAPTQAATPERGWEAFANRYAAVLLWGAIVGYIVVFASASSLKLLWFRQGLAMADNEPV